MSGWKAENKDAVESHKDTIINMWERGHSLTQIAMATNTSRNAVAGYIYRMRLKGEVRLDVRKVPKGPKMRSGKVSNPLGPVEKKLKNLFKAKSAPRAAPRPTVIRPNQKQAEEYDTWSLRVELLNLKPMRCKWPTHSDDRHHLFCGHPAPMGKPYCEHHAARSIMRAVGA